VKFGREVFEICERTDRQTDILITILGSPPGGEATNASQHLKSSSNHCDQCFAIVVFVKKNKFWNKIT